MPHCKTCCDVMYIALRYITPLMQCLTNDIRAFNMQLKTTKCLNTALMISFLFLGKKGLQHAYRCDSNALVKRYQKGEHDNRHMIRRMKQLILRPSKQRYMYYILMNEGYFGEKYFPGHVFILEKIPGGKYMLYQSYINQYDLKSYYESQNNTFELSFAQVQGLIWKLEYVVVHSKTWDAKCVEYWKEFTHVDTSNIQGAPHDGKLNICMSYAPIHSCLNNIQKYTQDKLRELKRLPPTQTFGNPEHFTKSSIQPLTVQQVQTELRQILEDIQRNKIL